MTPATLQIIDICQPPIMIRLAAGPDGLPAVTTEPGHTAVLLPQYGLMFAAAVGEVAKTQAAALKQAAKLRLFGYKDWRLSKEPELNLLRRLDRRYPAIDSDMFPGTPTSDWFWTATDVASYQAFAWGVAFGYGLVDGDHRSSSGFVRAVRSVPPSQCLAFWAASLAGASA